jgi:hypothetical protein
MSGRTPAAGRDRAKAHADIGGCLVYGAAAGFWVKGMITA